MRVSHVGVQECGWLLQKIRMVVKAGDVCGLGRPGHRYWIAWFASLHNLRDISAYIVLLHSTACVNGSQVSIKPCLSPASRLVKYRHPSNGHPSIDLHLPHALYPTASLAAR